MQNNTTPVNKNTNSRNNSKSAVVSAKKADAVNKNTKKSVPAKRSTPMRAVRTVEVVNVKKKDKSPFPWSVVLVAALMTALFLFMMMNYAEVDKYRSENAQLSNQLASLEKDQAELEVELGNKYDLKEIREYATEELGMVHVNEMPVNNIHYITVEQEDATEMHEYDDGEEGGFGFLLTGLGEVIKDFLK